MSKKLTFSVVDFAVEENPNSHFAILDMKIVSSGMNLHKLPITPMAIENASTGLFGKPILTHYIPEADALGGHDKEQIPVGVFLDKNIRLEKEEGKTWLYAKAYVWKKYFPHVVEVFRKNGGRTNISMEIEVNKSEFEDDGYEWIKDFNFLGVTAIGVRPAIEGSGGIVLQFSELVDEIQKEFSSKYDDIDFTIPSGVKKNAEEGLKLYEKNKKGGTSVSLATARFLCKNETATPEKIHQMAKFFSRRGSIALDSSSKDWTAWQLWGGNAGKRWSTELSSTIHSADNRISARFASREEVMPYAKISDANPAIKGIDPPVTVGQANEIAKQAEAIGSNDEKNGWTIAISNFKKTHEVEDGKWVRKSEKASEEEFAKEDLGDGEALSVDKSKDSMSNTAWGGVDKTSLRNKVLSASNYRSLVKDVYMKVEDGWEDAPSEHLKYPVMQVSVGKLVYNRHGLSAALAYAEKEGESAVASKIRGIYKKLGLDEANKEEASFDMNGMNEEMPQHQGMETNDAPTSDEGEDTYMAEDTKPKEEEQEAKEEEQEAKEEGKEAKEEEKEANEEKEGMSLDAYADVPALMSMLNKETEDYQQMADEMKKGDEADFSIIAKGLYFMCQEFAERAKSASGELEALKQFKADKEKEEFEAKVQATLDEVSKFMSPEEIADLQNKSKEFSLDTFDNWEKQAQALAFAKVKDIQMIEGEEIKGRRPFVQSTNNKQSKYIWS